MNLTGGPPNLKGIKSSTYFFAIIIHSPNPTFESSLSEISDFNCLTSCQVFSWTDPYLRKIKIMVNRRFDVSNIIRKFEVVYANVKVVIRELKILNNLYAHSTVLDVM